MDPHHKRLLLYPEAQPMDVRLSGDTLTSTYSSSFVDRMDISSITQYIFLFYICLLCFLHPMSLPIPSARKFQIYKRRHGKFKKSWFMLKYRWEFRSRLRNRSYHEPACGLSNTDHRIQLELVATYSTLMPSPMFTDVDGISPLFLTVLWIATGEGENYILQHTAGIQT
jgi:hypothetical protein